MMTNRLFSHAVLGLIFNLLSSLPMQAEERGHALTKLIYLKDFKGTIYESLEMITDKTGYYFVYDSDLINNEEKVKIRKGEYTIREAIYAVIKNKHLDLINVGNHILIQYPQLKQPEKEHPDSRVDLQNHISIEGSLFDQITNEPIQYSSIGILNTSIGTITNQDGYFKLQIPMSHVQSTIVFSHVGYQSKEFPISFLSNSPKRFTLEQKVTSIQEVIIRLNDPKRLIQNMLDKRTLNYADKPAVFTAFYREGVELKKDFIYFTEALFHVYKAPVDATISEDQVKLVKMRKITNEEVNDTLIAKIKSGIDACLMLDLTKNLPDFLQSGKDEHYNFAHTDIKIIENRMVHVISFEQKSSLKTPLYCGELFLDTENDALIMAQFEINPKYINKISNILVEKKSKYFDMSPKQVIYTISYKPYNNTYYISHIRGDLHFKIKKKKQVLGAFMLHTWFEMTTTDIDTLHTKRFAQREVIPTKNIFSDTKYRYDQNFWENFNIILPEDRLQNSIKKIHPKVEIKEGNQTLELP